LNELTILVKGGGDLGSGVAWKLFNAGLNITVLDLPRPMAIRRRVSFSEAINDKAVTVDGVQAKKIISLPEFRGDFVEVFTVDDKEILENFNPTVLVDATLKAIDHRTTSKNDAPLTIGLGNGFIAPDDIDCVIETNRGHNLGRVIWNGEAEKYTGVPGNIGGFTNKRLLRSPDTGKFKPLKKIGDHVEKNELIGWVNQKELRTHINGVIRGLIAEGAHVKEKMKIGDVDPRGIRENVYRVSDKARNIGGGVLEAVIKWFNEQK
ncbi:MAG: selenium-dependent molybdenum cofactor biosynthesis protein YqeB, partial [Elusimicrobia bacterium]|nr:selenium-dependent molybdenum cofactor biosynthesis protein YqeB [Elusimicrobiota bacterium]